MALGIGSMFTRIKAGGGIHPWAWPAAYRSRSSHRLTGEVRFGSRLCKNVFPSPKTARNRGRSASTRRFEHIFSVSSQESTGAQPRATPSDLNGHTMRITERLFTIGL